MTEPYAFVTKGGAVVLRETLNAYAIKDANDVMEDAKDPFKEKNQVRKDNEYVAGNDYDDYNTESKQAPENFYTSYGLYGLVEPPYNPKILVAFADLNTYHRACCSVKANDIGGLGHHLTVLEGQEEDTAVKALITQFLVNSNIEDTLTDAQDDAEQVGWGCLELIRIGGLTSGEPQRLEHIHAHTVRIHQNKRKFMQTWDGVIRRWFKRYGAKNYKIDPKEGKFDVNINTGEEVQFGSLKPEETGNELIYNPKYSSKTSYYGTPDYIPSIRTMIGDLSAVEFNISYFKNFTVPQYAVYVTGYFEDEPEIDPKTGKKTGKSVMQSAIEKKFKEINENPNSNLYLMIPQSDVKAPPINIKFVPLSTQEKDGHFRVYRLGNRDEIITAHRVDPYRIGVTQTGSLGGSTAIENKKSYKSSVAIPGQRKWEMYVNQIIWNEFDKGTIYSFKLEEVDAEDQTALEQSCLDMLKAGVMTPNDVIGNVGGKYGLKKVDHPAMNMHYMDGRVVEVESMSEVPMIGTGGPETDPAFRSNKGALKVFKDFKKSLEEAKKEYESSTKTD